MSPNTTIPTISKEQIKNLSFPKKEVLLRKEDQADRIIGLRRALILGNIERQKVRITFVDDTGFKKVETTIWGITDNEVILKQSTIIPLKRIISIS